MKLLGGEVYAQQPLSDHQKLACLAQRLPIEFNSTTYLEQSQEMQQIEGHLRVCLKINAGFESMQTLSPSEPLLSEAAYWIMQDETFDAASALKQVLSGFAVHKGDRGELVVMLLLTLARDLAVGPPNRLGTPKQRWTSVTAFFQSLFRAPRNGAPNNDVDIFKAKGYVVSSEGVSSYGHAFRTQFAESKFYFNHWIKVHQWRILNVKFLLSLYSRGVAILCGNSQPGIDGLMPFLWRGIDIVLDNIGVCLWQVKNYPLNVDTHLFNSMDPFSLGIYDNDAASVIPIVRIVFAIAATTPSLQVVRVKTISNDAGRSFITYDIWCSGLSPDILCPVAVEKQGVWHSLLQRSYGWQDVYRGHRVPKRLRRSMNPGAALDEDHWSRWNASGICS